MSASAAVGGMWDGSVRGGWEGWMVWCGGCEWVWVGGGEVEEGGREVRGDRLMYTPESGSLSSTSVRCCGSFRL